MAVKSKSTKTERLATNELRKVNVFHQRIGSLTYYQACQLLGENGSKLIQSGGQSFEVQSDRDVFLGGDLYRVRVQDTDVDGGVAIATITLQSGRNRQLQCNCDQCETPCEHLGAAIEFLLDAKTLLGLAMPPDESVPLENLTSEELYQRAISDRQKRAVEERMRVRSLNPDKPWVDYVVTSEQSGRSYRVAVRGLPNDHNGNDAENADSQSFCTCPDFRTNRLGTCKHILHVQAKLKKRFSAAQLRAPYRRRRLSLRLDYGATRGLLFNLETEAMQLAERREKVSAASGQLITAALTFAGELIGDGPDQPSAEAITKLADKLSQCVDRDSQGRPQLTISLPDDNALRGLATTLARLLES